MKDGVNSDLMAELSCKQHINESVNPVFGWSNPRAAVGRRLLVTIPWGDLPELHIKQSLNLLRSDMVCQIECRPIQITVL